MRSISLQVEIFPKNFVKFFLVHFSIFIFIRHSDKFVDFLVKWSSVFLKVFQRVFEEAHQFSHLKLVVFVRVIFFEYFIDCLPQFI